MPRSSNSEESDQQNLISQDSVELDFREKMPQYMASPSRFRQFISSCNAKRLIVSVAIVVTIGVLTFTTLTSRSRYSSEINIHPCGSTPEEAIALGCKLDR